MNAAATQDVRAIRFVPLLAELLQRRRRRRARAPRACWSCSRTGARRAAAASTATSTAGSTTPARPSSTRPGSGSPTPRSCRCSGSRSPTSSTTRLHRRFDLPPGGQFGGWHMYMDKDLRTLLGKPVKGQYANRYCGHGDAGACRAALWAALEAAGARARRRRRAPTRPPGARTPPRERIDVLARACCRTRCATPTGRAASSR